MNQIQQYSLNEENKSSITTKLIWSVLLDIIGMSSYSIPIVGELFDLIWAPISGILLARMYKGKIGITASLVGFSEELFPFTDVIPTFTLTWIYVHVIKKEK